MRKRAPRHHVGMVLRVPAQCLSQPPPPAATRMSGLAWATSPGPFLAPKQTHPTIRPKTHVQNSVPADLRAHREHEHAHASFLKGEWLAPSFLDSRVHRQRRTYMSTFKINLFPPEFFTASGSGRSTSRSTAHRWDCLPCRQHACTGRVTSKTQKSTQRARASTIGDG